MKYSYLNVSSFKQLKNAKKQSVTRPTDRLTDLEKLIHLPLVDGISKCGLKRAVNDEQQSGQITNEIPEILRRDAVGRRPEY